MAQAVMERQGHALSPVIVSPLVSVVIPAYNAEAYIERTLLAICRQKYTHLEIIVIDDGSIDRTAAIVRAHARRDGRIRLMQKTNGGVASARNLGIEQARGEFIAPIDADDIWYPWAMSKLVARFQACSPKVGVVYTWSIDINEWDQPSGNFHASMVSGDVYKTLICHNFLGNASSTLIRKVCFDVVGGYDSGLKAQKAQGCEDWDLYLRLADQYDYSVVPEFLVGYRKLSTGMSGDFSQMARSHRLMLQTARSQHPELPDFIYRISCSSFYLYLAQQCDASRNSQGVLRWIWQAVQADCLTPLGRLGTYLMLIKNLNFGCWTIAFKLPNIRVSLGKTDTEQPSQRAVATYISSVQSLENVVGRFKVGLKLAVGSLLHHSVSRF